MRKAERDNLNEATKQMLNLVRYSDPTSYVELINGHKEVSLLLIDLLESESVKALRLRHDCWVILQQFFP